MRIKTSDKVIKLKNGRKYARRVAVICSIDDLENWNEVSIRHALNGIADELSNQDGAFGFDACLAIVKHICKYGTYDVVKFKYACRNGFDYIKGQYFDTPDCIRKRSLSLLCHVSYDEGVEVEVPEEFACSAFVKRAIHDALVSYGMESDAAWNKAKDIDKKVRKNVESALDHDVWRDAWKEYKRELSLLRSVFE